MPSRRSTKPCAPASTTPAFCSTASWFGVFASAARACCSARRNQGLASPMPGCASSASAKAWMTLRMVPSRGSASACRADAAPARMACAKLSGANTGRAPAASARPVKNCARIAPELPRALSTASSPTRCNNSPALAVRRLKAPVSKPPRVKARLLPVSPSGTGNTLILLSVSRWAITRRAPAIRPRMRRAGSSRETAFIGASLPGRRRPAMLRRSMFRHATTEPARIVLQLFPRSPHLTGYLPATEPVPCADFYWS